MDLTEIERTYKLENSRFSVIEDVNENKLKIIHLPAPSTSQSLSHVHHFISIFISQQVFISEKMCS